LQAARLVSGQARGDASYALDRATIAAELFALNAAFSASAANPSERFKIQRLCWLG
jgi:hypothetical protein